MIESMNVERKKKSLNSVLIGILFILATIYLMISNIYGKIEFIFEWIISLRL